MLNNIFTTLSDIVSQFTTLLVSLFDNVVKIFYTTNETGGELTIVGTLMLVGLGTSLVIWGYKFIRSLIRVRTK